MDPRTHNYVLSGIHMERSRRHMELSVHSADDLKETEGLWNNKKELWNANMCSCVVPV